MTRKSDRPSKTSPRERSCLLYTSRLSRFSGFQSVGEGLRGQGGEGHPKYGGQYFQRAGRGRNRQESLGMIYELKEVCAHIKSCG